MSAAKIERKKVIRFGTDALNLEQSDPRYKYRRKCTCTYMSQATTLEIHEQEEMIQYMRNHDNYDDVLIDRDNVTSHKLYRATMQAFDTFGREGLSRPIYLILSSLYDKLPVQYVSMIRDHFGPLGVTIHTLDYLNAITIREERAFTTATNTSPKIPRARQALVSKSAVVTNTKAILNKGEEDIASGAGQQVTVLDSVKQINQNVALEKAKRPRALSVNPAIEPKRTRRANDNDGSDAAKPASTAAKKPRMASSDLLKMKEDVKIARETAMRNETKIDVASAKLDGFISEMRQFMTAFANTAGIPLPTEVIDESDNDNHE